MMEDTELIKKRLSELADRSYSKGQFTFTQFLNMAELSVYYEIGKTLNYAKPSVYGGYEGAERAVVRFGNPEELGYEEAFPIDLLEISPVAEKFADDLTHRDFLGALMNLGIERELLGDIIVTGKKAYLFCMSHITGFLTENLTCVKHTNVSVMKKDPGEITSFYHGFENEKQIQVQSERCDAVIAKVYNLSRSEAMEYFRQKKVFVNGRINENTSLMLKEGDCVTLRGYGRFRLKTKGGLTRKGRLNLIIEQ